MPHIPDRVYAIGQRFPIFPQPEFQAIQFAMAIASGNSAPESKPVDLNGAVYVRSRLGIVAPFLEKPLPFSANLHTIFDEKATEFPPPIKEPELILDIHNMSSELQSLGLLQYNWVDGTPQKIYDPEVRKKLERLLLVIHTQDGAKFSVPHIETHYQSAINYRQFLDLRSNKQPEESDFERFKATVSYNDSIKVDRDLAKIAALEGVFYAV